METILSRPTQPPGYRWRIFWVLLIASVAGVAAILPYVFALFGKVITAHPLSMPLPVLIVVQFMENMLLFAGVIALGLLLARKVGIETPVLQRWLYSENTELPKGAVRTPILSGVVGGTVV